MIKAVIFDCFGVLYQGPHHGLEEKFPQQALALSDLTSGLDYGMFSEDDYIEKVSQLLGISGEEIRQIVIKKYQLNTGLITYIVSELKDKYKIGMISNIGRGWIQNFFDEHQLHDVFNAVVLSGDEGVTKPHPQIYELMSERLEVGVEECVFIDDLPENIAGADAAGMHGIVYGNLRQIKQELGEILDA
jgi:HAD superfamily hydrolase (TIGR01509 family)